MSTTTTTAPTTSDVPLAPKPRGASASMFVKKFAGYALLIFFAIIYLYPFVIQIATSFKTDADAAQNPVALRPDPFTTAAWERLFDGTLPFPTWLANSVFVTIVITVGRVLFDSLAGYALSRLKFRGRDPLFLGLLAIMSVPGVVLLIPRFLVLIQLGIWDTYAAMIIPLLSTAAGIFIMKQFFDSIPYEIEEAARIDGAGIFRTFWSVVLPMARPALITVTILAFQGSWNEFTHFLVATQNPDLYTLNLGLAQLTSGQLGSGQQFPLTLAAALLVTIPVAIMFFVFQRHFVQGGQEGGVKG
jgi:multiple sugar transport system permease protein